MMQWEKILIAVENFDATKRAVKYVGTMIGGRTEPQVTLLHVYPEPPPNFYQTGGVLSEYKKNKEENARQLLDDARTILTESGVSPQQIVSQDCMAEGKTISQTILGILQDGEYGTVVVGKRGVSRAEEFLFGSISNTLVHSSGDFTVWVVG